MNVDAPMWSDRRGAVGCGALGAIGPPPTVFHRSASFFTSSLTTPSSAISRSTARKSSMMSALSAALSVDASAESSRATSAAYRPRTSGGRASGIPRQLLRRTFEHDALVGGEQLRHVEEDDEPLTATHDPA